MKCKLPMNTYPKLKNGFMGERSIVLPDMVRRTCAEDAYLCQLYITDIGYYPHAMHHYRERPDGTGQYILIYCMKGSGWYSTGGMRREVSAGQYFVLPQGVPHVYASNNDDPWTIYWIHFAGQQAQVFAADINGPQTIDSSMTSRISDRNNIFEEIFLTLSAGYSHDNLYYAMSLLYGFLATFRFLGHFRRYNSAGELASADNADNIVNAAVRFMRENMERQLTLAEIASFVGYSASRFSTIFRSKTGHPVLGYFNILKIQRSCQLLETTDMKINQICAKVGIDDSYYFSRLFRKITGLPPREYRHRATAGRRG